LKEGDFVAIQTFGLKREFNSLVAVNELDLGIKEGELFSLLGPNGAGKTTTINMLCCLLKPTSGTAKIIGYDIIEEPYRVKEVIGVSPQETAISEQLNSWENLALIGKAQGMSTAELKKRAEELLEIAGLRDRAKDKVGKFSGGMKRRLNLMMALIHDPEILFLDEPTLGLDPQSRRAIWEYIDTLKGKKTILLTTHYMEEADALSDRIGIIDEGKIVALGTPEELKRNYAHAKSMLISAENITPHVLAGLRAKYSQVEETEEGLKISSPDLDFKEIIDLLHSQGVAVHSAALEQPTLEDVFLSITGKGLRE
jgi:ABC-2 type transport system ATP-binding protein